VSDDVTDAGPATSEHPAPERPLVSIKGDASPEEVAALVAVVQALAAAQSVPPRRRPRSVWADPARQMHRPLHPSPDGWKRSALPG
jgi:hypothetical protein